MSSSIAPRRKLFAWPALAALVLAFLLAFFYLRSTREPGWQSAADKSTTLPAETLESASVAKDKPVELDELELAYLKAQRASGRLQDTAVAETVLQLLRSGRQQAADTLLQTTDDLILSERLRFELDMELSASRSDDALLSLFNTLQESPELHQESLLQRALELSKPLKQPILTYRLYLLLARHSDRAAARWLACGEYFADIKQFDFALACYDRVQDSEADDTARWTAQHASLPLLQQQPLKQQNLIESLLADEGLTTRWLERCAEQLLSIERPDAAYRFYAKLALAEPTSAHRWLPMAARWAEAAERPLDAAVFLHASLPALPVGEQKSRRQKIESLLLGAGELQLAFETRRERIEADPNDWEILREGIVLARQIGDFEQAYAWNARWLSNTPEDIEATALQLQLSLALGQLESAQGWAERQVTLKPDDRDVQRQLATVSEWNGDPQRALAHWLELADEKQTTLAARTEALREVSRLATMTFQPALTVNAMRQVTLLNKPNMADLEAMVQAFELDGRAEDAAVALKDIIVTHGPDASVYRLLANLQYRHHRYKESYKAWQDYEAAFAATGESILARTELLWRQGKQDEAANAAKQLRGRSLLSQTDNYQLKLLAEIAWQYRMPWLTALVQPRLESLANSGDRIQHGNRSIDVLLQQGQHRQALQTALRLWESTAQPSFALQAINLALKLDDQDIIERFHPDQPEAVTLLAEPSYWNEMAAVYLRGGNDKAALTAFDQALKLDPDFAGALVGRLWLLIAMEDVPALRKSLTENESHAEHLPELWQATAIGYLQLGAASQSLRWFEKSFAAIETDYGMLLTYADALEYAGRSARALQVRSYAIERLRPLLVASSQTQQALLLRQYGRLSTRYASIESNEELIAYLLSSRARSSADTEESDPAPAQLWREDMAIAWFMATQQHELARLVIADMHTRRIKAPSWQRLALAMHDKDKDAIAAILNDQGLLSVGNHVLALRQIGQDRQAYVMAEAALQPGAYWPGYSVADRRIVQNEYLALRAYRPSYLGASVQTTDFSQLGMTETALQARHTLAVGDWGLGLSVIRRRFDTDRYRLDRGEELSEVALSLFYGNAQRGATLTTGFLTSDVDEDNFAGVSLYQQDVNRRRTWSGSFTYNEAAQQSASLLLAARQNRVQLTLDQSFRNQGFTRIEAGTTEIYTAQSDEQFARGFDGQLEVGVRGTLSSHNWSTSVRSGGSQYDRVDSLPGALQLRPDSTLDSVLAEKSQYVSVGGSLSRGDNGAVLPAVSSPRYFLDARLAHYWPDRRLGLQVNAGAGFRVLGGDELSFSVAHEAQTSEVQDDTTAVGVNYRYHFQ